jgi:HEAT repeat protein
MGSAGKTLLPEVFDAFRNPPENCFYSYTNFETAIADIDPEGREAIPVLIALLDHNKPMTKVLALRALLGYGPKAKEAIPVIERLAESKDQLVHENAAGVLAAIRKAQPSRFKL